jgi:sulfate-transporting ATPase
VAIGGGLVVGVVLIQGVLPDDWVTAVTTCLVVGTVLLSLVVVTGYAGQLSLAQFALAGIGALVAARLVATAGWSIVPASIAGAAAAVPVGLVVGLPAVRTRGVNLGVITLGLAVAAQSLFFDNQTYTNGTDGLSVGSPHLFGINVDALLYPRRYATVALIIFALLGLGVLNLRRSAIGRKLVAVRANERAAASLGISVTATKLYAFVAAAVIAAVGGVLIAFQNEVVVFGGIGTSFDPFHSITAVAEATIGGVGYVGGALAGSTIEPGGVGQKLLDGISLGSWLPVIGGALLLFTIITAPDGIAANLQRQFSPLLARLPTLRRRRRSTPPVISGATPPLTQRAELIVEGVTVSFGAEPVVNDVSLTLRSGQVLGIIGANGAGKTTLVDAITGYAAPRRGSIRLDGREIGGLGPAARSRLGLVRSFQALELFEDLTVSDNLLAASEAAPWHRGLTAAAWPGSAQLSDSARVAVTQLGLEPHLDATPFDLSYGNRRLLAIARALAARPRVLLLDEPAAGLDQNERDELRALIRRLAETWQIAVLLIEHDVDLVLSVSDEVLALDFGRVIAAGAPTDVRGNREVISAYLGEEVPA